MTGCVNCGAPAEAGLLGTGNIWVALCWTHADAFMEGLSHTVPAAEGRAGLDRWYAETTGPDGSRHLSPLARPA